MRLYALVFDVSWALAMLLGLDGAMPDSVLPGWLYPVLSLAFLGGMLYSGIKLHNS